MNPQRNAVLLWTIVLGTFLVFSSCSVFTPVGEAISQQYENTVSYFNAFYNARRLFTEAEDQIRTAQLTLRGKDVSGTAAAIPARAAGLGRDLPRVVPVKGIVEHLVAYHSSGLMTKPVSGLG